MSSILVNMVMLGVGVLIGYQIKSKKYRVKIMKGQ
jgi:hypothetical protein